ncbi:hypothetical protein [Knoellia koreensis]|uniref:Peptidase M48 domain-containing protein n=1 Tax=Knoellia koreensis TaxID=2730921 RepID=A0A849HB43_9MICO|nr:hypothetical protein [Knoellia sp. DB2414S]NNM46946.1 hypothetical protein [Knoellia sp. DB2414S]
MTTSLKKVLACGPAVVVSVMLTFVFGSVLPPLAGLAAFVIGLGVMLALLVGWGEPLASRLLFHARALNEAEIGTLAPAVAMLCQRGIPMGRLDVRVKRNAVPIAAVGVGRRTVVVSGGLMGAIRDEQLPVDQAAAVLGHCAGVVLSGAVRSDPALAYWTLPWQLTRALVGALVQPFRRLPLAALAWRGRFVVALVAAVQSVIAEQLGVAGALVTLCALSYLLGAGEGAWAATLREIGDDRVRQAGLADALARLLLRCSSSAATHERVHALTGPHRCHGWHW